MGKLQIKLYRKVAKGSEQLGGMWGGKWD